MSVGNQNTNENRNYIRFNNLYINASNLRFRELNSWPYQYHHFTSPLTWDVPTTVSAPKASARLLKAPGGCPSLTTDLKSQTPFCYSSCGKFSCMGMVPPPPFVINLVPANIQKINSVHFPLRGKLLEGSRKHRHRSKISASSKMSGTSKEGGFLTVCVLIPVFPTGPMMRGSSCAPNYAPFRTRMKKTAIKENS